MTIHRSIPSGRERDFASDELIVTKTDSTGRITYANDVFIRVSGFSECELLGQPHSMIRHPDMPRAVFKLLWDRLKAGEEVFAYVVNLAKNGDHYWVLAHVSPDFAADGAVSGFHSSRRCPTRQAIEAVRPVYQKLKSIESQNADRKAGLEQSARLLDEIVAGERKSYDEFVLGL